MFINSHTFPGTQVFQFFTRQLTVGFKLADIIINIAIVSRIGISLFDQHFNHVDDVIHRGSGTWLFIRRQDTQRQCILMHGLNKSPGQIIKILTIFIGPGNDLVIYICNITHIGYFITRMSQVTSHHIKHHQYPCMPKMTKIVYRHSTDIHANLARFDGFEFFFLIAKAIVNFQHK